MVKSTQPVYSWQKGNKQSKIILWVKPCPVLILQERQCRKNTLTQVGSLKGQKTPHCFCSKLWKFCLATYPELKSYEKHATSVACTQYTWHSRKRNPPPSAPN